MTWASGSDHLREHRDHAGQQVDAAVVSLWLDRLDRPLVDLETLKAQHRPAIGHGPRRLRRTRVKVQGQRRRWGRRQRRRRRQGSGQGHRRGQGQLRRLPEIAYSHSVNFIYGDSVLRPTVPSIAFTPSRNLPICRVTTTSHSTRAAWLGGRLSSGSRIGSRLADAAVRSPGAFPCGSGRSSPLNQTRHPGYFPEPFTGFDRHLFSSRSAAQLAQPPPSHSA